MKVSRQSPSDLKKYNCLCEGSYSISFFHACENLPHKNKQCLEKIHRQLQNKRKILFVVILAHQIIQKNLIFS